LIQANNDLTAINPILDVLWVVQDALKLVGRVLVGGIVAREVQKY
jgi:hypothetical protein